MKKKLVGIVGLLLLLCGVASSQIVIYSDANDGFLEVRSLPVTPPDPTIHPNTFNEGGQGWQGTVGEWYAGLVTIVLPFQLPDVGAIDNPFVAADFGVMLNPNSGDYNWTDIDLYAVRIDPAAEISTNDWYNGSVIDSSATLIQESFLTPSSPKGWDNAPNNNTDSAGDAALLSYLNAVYDGGAGAGQFVFLRLSYGADAITDTSGEFSTDNYNITLREAGSETEWPVLTVTTGDLDSDEDGLPNVWEIDNGLDPYDDGSTDPNNGANGNPDEDGLVNSDEFALDTDPQNPDTDDDGLNDGPEVYTYGTDPLAYDTDGDSLNDGDEISYGTNPLEPHSDEDGESDGIEVSQGTDPLDTLSSSAALGLVIIDGTVDAVLYGDAVSTQLVNASWGDNNNELNAAFATVRNGKLHLMLTGNIEDNFNKYEIFIDCTDVVTTNVLTTAGNDGSDFMNGLTFDEGFSPDYHLIARRGWGTIFDLDMSMLGTTNVSGYQNVFIGSMEGFAHTGTGDANASPIGIAYDNSNTNGIAGGEDAADPVAALSATTGLELSIALSDLGNPASIRIMVMINGANHDWISNQVLGGLTPPQGALGRDGFGGGQDGLGNDLTNLSMIDFNNFSGDQFFDVEFLLTQPEITMIQLVSGNTEVHLGLSGLSSGAGYMVQDTASLLSEFADIPGSYFTATETNMVISLPADTDANPVLFYQVVTP